MSTDRIDLRQRLALRKLGNPVGFKFFLYEAMEPDGCLMTGCVVTKTHTKGKKKGQPIYDGARRRVCITEAEVAAERGAFEAETGMCGECTGTGKLIAGWDHIRGEFYRECSRCKGSGQRPSAEAGS